MIDYIQHLESCFEKAQRLESKISQDIIDMEGMTGLMTRHFYNNLLNIEDARYLEIGVWKGSSSCAAMYGNKAIVNLIEDFSGFGSPRRECLGNLEKYGVGNEWWLHECCCFKIDIRILGKSNIYLFDADHSENSTRLGITYYLAALDDTFILVMDDWNMGEVRNGTEMGIIENNLDILWSKEIRLTDDNSHTPAAEAAATWHNGIAVFILKQNK